MRGTIEKFLPLFAIALVIFLFVRSCVRGEPDFFILAVALASIIPFIWDMVQTIRARRAQEDVLELDSKNAVGRAEAAD